MNLSHPVPVPSGGTMFEETKFKRLAAVEQYAPAILKEFSELLNARAMIRAYDEKNFRFLSIEKIDSYTIDANYHGATVWSLRRAIPWLNQLPQKTPTFGI